MNNIPHILLVDDDNRICKLLKQFFDREGFITSTAPDVSIAKQLIRMNKFDLIILDVMLPGVTGFDFAKILKNRTDAIPIILLTALSEIEHRITGLETGADDYLVKPIEPRELLLRAKKLIELYSYNNKDFTHFGNNVFNNITKEFKRLDRVINLTSAEMKLLELFIGKVNQPLSRELIAKFLGGVSERSVDVSIVRLRQKLEDDAKNPRHLQTIRNEGYVFYY